MHGDRKRGREGFRKGGREWEDGEGEGRMQGGRLNRNRGEERENKELLHFMCIQ